MNEAMLTGTGLSSYGVYRNFGAEEVCGMRYRLEYVAVFHPRPLQCGVWVGERKEVPCKKSFVAASDAGACFQVPQILDPCPKLPQTPGRTVHARKLVQVDGSGNEVRVVTQY
jgi:hypothetical protein